MKVVAHVATLTLYLAAPCFSMPCEPKEYAEYKDQAVTAYGRRSMRIGWAGYSAAKTADEDSVTLEHSSTVNTSADRAVIIRDPPLQSIQSAGRSLAC